jgi:hypothetical protein
MFVILGKVGTFDDTYFWGVIGGVWITHIRESREF